MIERQVAIVQPDRLAALRGHGLACIVEVSLDRQGAEQLDAFEARAVRDDAVQQCWRVSPGPRLRSGGAHARHAGLSAAHAAAFHGRRQRAQRQGLLRHAARKV